MRSPPVTSNDARVARREPPASRARRQRLGTARKHVEVACSPRAVPVVCVPPCDLARARRISRLDAIHESRERNQRDGSQCR